MAFRHILRCHWVVVELSRRYWLQIQISVTKDDIDSSLHVLACEVAHPRTRYERTKFNFASCANVAWYILQSMALGSTQPLAEVSKVKQPHYRPWQALRFPGLWSSQILRQSAHEGGKIVSLTHRQPLLPGNIPGTHFCWMLSRPQGHSAAGRIVNEKFQWHHRESFPRPFDL
jgi:hypothetical protein